MIGCIDNSRVKTPSQGDQMQNVSDQNQNLTRGEIMRAYFPLKEGNSWTYKRTLIDPENVCTYSEQTAIVIRLEYP